MSRGDAETNGIDFTRRRLQGWGGQCASNASVFRPRSVEDASFVIADAAQRGLTVVPRGSGYSYGDVSLNGGNVVLDVTAMDRILAWDPISGVCDVEPGVTVAQLCDHVSADGWWPPVVPGTSAPTVGGCVGSNVHGKNNWIAGTFGEQVEEIDLLMAGGSIRLCSFDASPELFRAVVGGYGLLGVVTRIRLRMKRSSGVVDVQQYSASELDVMMEFMDRWAPVSDYLVGWVDAFATGDGLGRGLVQSAQVTEIDGVEPHRGRQRKLPPLNPVMGRLLAPLINPGTLCRLNNTQYFLGAIAQGRHTLKSQRDFEFFHDTVPFWNRMFPSGVIQYQMFVPSPHASTVFQKALTATHEIRQPPILTVLKKHRVDGFVLSYGVDGFSLSMDFRVTPHTYDRLMWRLKSLSDETVLPAGGRFYLAKDITLTAQQAKASLGEDAVARFLEIKKEIDPNEAFASDVYRRLLNPPRPLESRTQRRTVSVG